ncbi:MAG TPA: MFS transporter, partial [Gaiellaceae bacterium]|nr:MFS transporter [Gaiellaceae bacterium]
IWGAVIGAAVAIGPLVGGALTEWAGWRWIFFVNLPIGAVCLFFGSRVLHESRDEGHGGIDWPGQISLSAGLFALVLGLLRGNDWGWSSGRVVGLLAGAVLALVLFGVAELRQANPMFDVRLFSVPAFAGAQVVAFSISSAMFAQFLYLTLYLQNILSYSPLQAGLRFLPLSMISFFAAPLSGRLSARIPIRILLGVGMTLVALALYLMYGVHVSSGWTTLLAGFLVGGVGVGMVNPPLATTAVSVVPPQRAGMAAGVNNTFRQVGIATGIAGLGAIFQASYKVGGTRAQFVHGLNDILLVATFVAAAGAVLAFALVRAEDFVVSAPAAAAGH